MKTELWDGLPTAILTLIISGSGIVGPMLASASVRVVVPNSAEKTEGGCACDYPFNVGDPDGSSPSASSHLRREGCRRPVRDLLRGGRA
jgi:hypothetical protein